MAGVGGLLMEVAKGCRVGKGGVVAGGFRRVCGSGCFSDSSPCVLPDMILRNPSTPEYGIGVVNKHENDDYDQSKPVVF